MYADNTFVTEKPISGTTDEWAFTFENVYKTVKGDPTTDIDYTFKELDGDHQAIEGYTLATTGDIAAGIILTNTHTPETIDISGTMTWDDVDDQDGIRPDSIKINLYAGEEQIDSKEVTAPAEGGNIWTYEWKDLPKYDSGKKIEYSITEEKVTGYTQSIDGFDITNKHTVPAFTVDKKVSVNGGAYQGEEAAAKAGDSLTYQVTLKNTGNAGLTFKAEDLRDVLTIDGAPAASKFKAEAFELAPGKEKTFTYEGNAVAPSDNEIANTFFATGTVLVSGAEEEPDGTGGTVPETGAADEPAKVSAPEDPVTKEVSLTEKDAVKVTVEENKATKVESKLTEVNGNAYTGGNVNNGDTLTYVITVTNTGNADLDDVALTNILTQVTGDGEQDATSLLKLVSVNNGSGNIDPADSYELKEGETLTFTYTAAVPEKATKLTLVSAATNASDECRTEVNVVQKTEPEPNPNPEPEPNPNPNPDKEETPDKNPDKEPETPDKDDTVKINPHLTVTKTVTGKPKNEDGYVLNEEIKYKIVVKNDGNVTIKDVVLTDELTGGKWNIGTLAAGKSATKETSYKVTQKDVENGSVVNVAAASGKSTDAKNTKVTVKEGRVEVSTYAPKKNDASNTSNTTNTTSNTTAANGSSNTNYTNGTRYVTSGGTVHTTTVTRKSGDDLKGDDLKGAPVKPSKTGDENDVMMWMLILLAAMTAAGGAWGVTRKRKKEHK